VSVTYDEGRVAWHPEPVWRDRASYLIHAPLEGLENLDREQLWVRELGAGLHEVCCIPMFVYELALGDVVRADDSSMLAGRVRRSGHGTVRVLVLSGADPFEHATIKRLLERHELLYEESPTPGAYAVDLPNRATQARFISELEAAPLHCEYEVAESASP
jgi:hypothetical protein